MKITKNEILKALIDLSQDQILKLIPMHQLYEKIKVKEHNINKFHELLVKMENENKIYLEPINDSSRLSLEKQILVINDTTRGSLYYIGFWEN